MLSNSLTFAYASAEVLTVRRDGHYHIFVPTFYDFGSYSNKRVDFVFDTGAFLTVLTRKEAMQFDFIDRYTTQTNVPLAGFTGGCTVDIKEIPGMVIGGRRLEGVKVAVPHENTNLNILGLNVIELFKYYVDTENDMIYFADNPNPTIEEPLRCVKVHILSPDLKWK